MRYTEILTEVRADYTDMFRFVSDWEKDLRVYSRIFTNQRDVEAVTKADIVLDRVSARWAPKEIAWARRYLKRHDRIIWWLRFARICLLKTMARDMAILARDKHPQIMLLSRKITKMIVAKSSIPVTERDVNAFRNGSIQRDLEHLFSLPIPAIQTYRPEFENPTTVLKRFRAVEKTWQETSKGLVPDDHEGRIILRFPNGLVWMQLDRAACTREGDAMGHCGNVPSQQRGETLLSLRQPVKKDGIAFWKPFLTFVLGADGRLGEMKGRFNMKPRLAHEKGAAPSDFHAEIEALLRLPIIKGIKGGGYKPEQNFALTDLDDDRRRQLLAAAPHLATVSDHPSAPDDEAEDD